MHIGGGETAHVAAQRMQYEALVEFAQWLSQYMRIEGDMTLDALLEIFWQERIDGGLEARR